MFTDLDIEIIKYLIGFIYPFLILALTKYIFDM